jgi:hypothetical protein
VVTDKGYHSRQVVSDLNEWGVRTYCSEPNRGRQRWQGRGWEQQAVHANRPRLRGLSQSFFTLPGLLFFVLTGFRIDHLRLGIWDEVRPGGSRFIECLQRGRARR